MLPADRGANWLRPGADDPGLSGSDGKSIGRDHPDGACGPLWAETSRVELPTTPPADAGPASSAPADVTLLTAVDLATVGAWAVQAGASDVHLRAGSPPMLRVDGQLLAAQTPSLGASDVSALVRPALDSAGVSDRYDRDGQVDFALQLPTGRFRANAYRSRGTDALVLRRVHTQIPAFTDLELSPSIAELSRLEHGLVLVCGPTGSGKTTTLAALIGAINAERACHILTIEDPIEYLHHDDRASISQREVHTDTRDFPGALRAGLRQDPDVIMVGEIRDTETMRIALQAAQTGHLVLASLHANSVAESVNRCLDMFPPDEQRQARAVLAESLRAIVCQRLAPAKDASGRHVITELGIGTTRLRDAIADPDEGVDIEDILREGDYYGMHTFEQAVLTAIMDGRITLESGEAIVPRPADLQVALKRAGYRG